MLATDLRRRNGRSRAAALLLALLLALPARKLHAQDGTQRASAADRAAAEELFLEGRRHMEAGDFTAACAKLAESERLDRAGGTLLNLADCYEKNGQLASALATFREARAAAERDGRAEWAGLAVARATLLEPRVPTMTVVVDAALMPPGLEVLREGAPIPSSLWGSPVPLDPSLQRIEARAPGRKPWGVTVQVDADHAHVVARVPELELLPQPREAATRPVPDPATERPLQKPAAIALLGGAAVSLGAGSVLGALAIASNAEAARRCPTSPACSDPSAVTLTHAAKSEATASTISFAASGVLLAVGAALFLTAPSKRPPLDLRPAVTVGKDGLGIALEGAF